MKSASSRKQGGADGSLPVRGAWIEMLRKAPSCDIMMSLPVRGAWIEIPDIPTKTIENSRRSPCGERGLKSASPFPPVEIVPSLPVRGAWIEIKT